MTFGTSQKRAYALDALRGFAILAMVLSGTIAYRILPAWMYHAQEPPPTHTFNPQLAGLTWVDIVFPLFLFSMGAAIPLALSRRIDKGWRRGKIILFILKRGFLLGAFAIILQHFRPQVISSGANLQKWLIALLGFLLLFLMFVRLPGNWKPGIRHGITASAWLVAIVVLAFMQYPDGSGFSLSRSDIILVVLANMAVFGSILWWLTRYNLFLRVGLLGLLFALRLSSTADGWIKALWLASPVPWIFQFDYLKYLFILIPGTIAGDLIIAWLQTSKDDIEENFWFKRRYAGIVLLLLVITVMLLVGLQARWVWQISLASAVLCTAGWFLFVHPVSTTEKLLHQLYRWGIYWLGLGLLFEPYQGGVKKDPATMSYFFITTAIAIFILIAFTIIINIFQNKKWLQLLIANGQNPMIAYVGFANLLWPILNLTKVENLILGYAKNPLFGFLKGIIYTLIVAGFVSLCTRLKLFWRT